MPPDGVPDTLMPFAISFAAKAGSTLAVENLLMPFLLGSFKVPWIVSAPTATSATLFWSTSCSN